jgi:fibronectin-binding autotransporter adhesin
MNRIFRIIWSTALNTWVVVSELATRRGKRSGGAEVDERVPPQALMLDRDMVEGCPPSTAWPLRIGILLALLSLHVPAEAANRYWDANGTAVGSGGTGTWDTTSAFWSASTDGVSGPFSPWNNAALDDAFFGGTAGTVTLGGPISVHNLTFLSNGYTISGGTLTLGGTAPTIDTGNGAVNQTINSIIAGSAGLTKSGTGTLTLNGVNTFTGAVNINAGGVSVGSNAAFGNASNIVNLANGASLTSGASLIGRTVNLTGAQSNLFGGGAGSAFFTGTGGVAIFNGVNMTNAASNYTGQTLFWIDGSASFNSVGNVGQASSLGAGGTIRVVGVNSFQDTLTYTGDGDTSNRDWLFDQSGPSSITNFYNSGSGTLTLTGNISSTASATSPLAIGAMGADLDLQGVISSPSSRLMVFRGGGVNRTITLGGANTYAGATWIGNSGAVTVRASVLADTGVASSFGTNSAGGGTVIQGGGVLSYIGDGDSSNRVWSIDNSSLLNDGTGVLTLSGAVTTANSVTLGGSYAGTNTLSGAISGTGNLIGTGAGTWVLSGSNTRSGTVTVQSGTLRGTSASAFGTVTGVTVNGGTLDTGGFDLNTPTLAGTGGTVALGAGNLTLNAAVGVTTNYAGSITGTGGLTKNGASTQTLSGTNSYTGATTINGGTLRLDFGSASAPTSNIISSASTLNMGGGTLSAIGASGEANSQTFNGLFVSAGNNTIGATSGAGGSMTVNLGAITRTGGLVNFMLPGSGNITTTNTTLGGWATVNGTDYAKVVGGNIVAFTNADYTDKDEVATWLNGEFISDSDGDAESFFGTLGSSVQLGGLQFTTPDATTTVNIAAGQTLGIDGTIIVAPSVLSNNQTITGGSITGMSGGGVLGIQQGSTGNFTIASQIVDNGGSIGFTKAGTGLVTLNNASNNYTGATTVSQGTLSVNNIANGGTASSIGASSAASSNLYLEGSTLQYTGGTATSDRGFTIAKSGAILGSTIDVSLAATNLTFGGLVTSTDGANFTKSGAGTLTLSNAGNDYTGRTTVSGGTLEVTTLANGGLVSSIGASSNASGNLVLNGGTLMYSGGTASTDRGFTVGNLAAGGSSGGIGVSNAATTLTVSGTAAGDDGLRKEGAGTLVLSGTNTYSGGTTVNAGTLRAGSTAAFGSTANNLSVATGATVDLNGFNTSMGALLGIGNVTLGSATLTSTGNNGTFSGVISGSGGFTRGGGFTTFQTMSGCNNTYTGATSLNNGQISVDCLANGGLASGIGASSSASSNLVFNTGVLRYTGGSVNIDRGFTAQSGPAVIDVLNAATTLGFSGPVVGGGSVRKDGAGTLLLSGNNTYSGGTQVTGGVLRAGSATAFGTAGLTLDNTAGVTLDLNGFNVSVSALNGGGASGGNISLGAQTLTITNGGFNYAGSISGTGNLIKTGGNVQGLLGCRSSYTGTTTINGSTVTVDCLVNGGANSSIGASSSIASNLIINGGTLFYSGAATSSDRLFTLGTSGGALSSSGTGPLQLTNTGLVALSGTNTARTFTLAGTNTGDNLFGAQLDNNGTGVTSLTKIGTGTWILTNNNSNYTGVTTINGGVLGVSQLADGGLASGIGASSSAASNLVIGNGSTLRYTGTGDTTNRGFTLSSGVAFIESSGTGAINFTNTGTIGLSNPNVNRTVALGGTNTGNNTLAGIIGNSGTGITTLAKNDSGTWLLTGNNTYTGNTVINDGNLIIGNGGTSGNLGVGNVIVDSPTSTLSMNRSDTVTFNATMSGPGAFAQIGTGTTTLTANNSIGATRVDAGTLDVNGTLNTATIAMGGTSTLNVDGTVQAAGGSAAVLTGDAGNSTINVNGGAILRANGDLGDGSDIVTVTGTLDTGSAVLGLGVGNDTLTLNDGAAITGAGVDAGTGTNDNLVINNAVALIFNGTGFNGFEQLTKNDAGTLTLTGNQTFSAGTAINGGTLDVEDTLETAAVTMAGGTTLNVDGTVQGVGGTLAALTGDAGTQTINVNAGATLQANGDLGDGVDNLTVAGTLNTGAAMLNLGAGNEIFILRDGASISGGGVNADAGTDQLVLDNAGALTFNGGTTAGFETLLKQNTGAATMTGSQSFTGGAMISGGTLDVDGVLQTPTVVLADGTALNIDGSLQAGIGTAASITGSAGVNTVTVNGSLLASGDLGAGNDVLDVHGTLDTGGGTFMLGDGDDTFAVYDGTIVTGTVDGGAGQDSRVYDINLNADVGALLNFETLTKTGTGTLDINGPGASSLQDVNVLGGTLNIAAGGSVIAAVGNTLQTIVGGGATLNVDGSYGCGAGNDTMTVAGTVSGAGTIDLCDGDDTLTLNDGAVLNNTISGGLGTSDALVLNNTGILTFNAANTSNFELLRKNNTGVAILTGEQAFSGGTVINGGTLSVGAGGTLYTPAIDLADNATFNVDGFASGGPLFIDSITLTGSTGANTVSVAEGGHLVVSGTSDLGAGDDVLDVAGVLDVIGGSFNLGEGDDRFIVHDTTTMLGGVDAGAGIDLLEVNVGSGNTVQLGALNGFESLGKSGLGTLQINGPSSFIDVEALAGLLDVAAGGSVAAQNTTVFSGATLNLEGAYTGTAGNDSFIVAGTVTGGSTLDLLGGDDLFTIQDGADLSGLANAVDGGAGTDTLTADLTGGATLNGAINFETLTKSNTGTLLINGPAASSFAAVNVTGGTLDIGAGSIVDGVAATTVANGATLHVDGNYTGSAGNDTMTVAGTVDGTGIVSLADGDDTLILTDGAVLDNVVDGGNHSTGDTVVLDNTGVLTVNAVANFEFLTKNNVGEAILSGSMGFTGGTTINGGLLTVTGDLGTPTVAMADGTALTIDGTLQAGGGAAASITGSAGGNTVTINGAALATGDLGGGNDVLDVTGTLDMAGGMFALGDGDDVFIVHDGTSVVGTVDGGAGVDTRVYDIDLTADVGALVNFEGVTKTGAGTLNINGPGATDLQEVQVLDGTLNIGVGASVVATGGSALNTVIGSGATLNVDGSYGCGDGNDSTTVSGTIQGAGIIDMCGGEDTLTLNDGAVLNAVISGGTHGAGDTVVLNNANALTFDASNTINFEFLQKENTGTATLAGTQSFSGGTAINAGTLEVGGTLETPTVTLADDTTLKVDGRVQGAGGTAATITGSAGVNTVTVNGTLLANGDLGSGNDVLDVIGMLDTAGGTFALGDGDDRLIVHDTTSVSGTVDAGAGIDLLEVNIGAGNTVPLGALGGFESLGKSGLGTLQINGPSSFIDVEVLEGTLDVSATANIAAVNTTVSSGAMLNLDGSYTGTAGDDSFTVAGTVTGDGTVALLGGNDTFTMQDGADLSGLSTPVDGGDGTDTIVADFAGEATLGGAVDFETLTKTNTGILNIDGPAASAFTTVNINGGTIDVGVNGSVEGVVATTVTSGATLNVDGRFAGSNGTDTMTVAGTVTGSGSIALLDGDDTLVLQDGADTSGLVNAIDGGAGIDTVNAAVASTMVLGPTINFETLQKTGTGELTLQGNQAYVKTQVDAGRLSVASGTVLTSQNTTIAAGSTLDVQGTFAGTAGDDTFTSTGTVTGALGFGDGNDDVDFTGGNVSGLTAIDGGGDGSDRLSFSGLSINSSTLAMTGWERVELSTGSTLTLGNTLALSGGVLSIDATSQLEAGAGASIGGSIENSGRINVGSNRLAIAGGYSANNGELQLTVSPSGPSSGGLDIAGDVTGTTAVAFTGDGSEVFAPQEPTSILVISSPNDNLATAGSFTPAGSVDGMVRVEGSVMPWTFGQHADDKNWYLEAEAAGVLPEIGGYAVLPSIGAAGIRDSNRLLYQRMSAMRTDTPRCGASEEQNQRAYTLLTGDCHGLWVAASASELEMGANPGFEFSGDTIGLYVGMDLLLQDRSSRTLRGGLFAGFQRGNYWTTGVNSTELAGTGESNVQTDTPTFGMYGSVNWSGGTYLDMSLAAQLPQADIVVADGFQEEIAGNSLTLSAQLGHSFQLGNGWTVEPQVQLSASAMQWGNTVDASGKNLVLDDDLLGTARAAVHAERVFETAGGARIRPWATIGLQDTMGEKENALNIMAPGADTESMGFPNHELGLTATVDVGVETELNKSVSLFGVLSYGESVEGTDSEERQANLGVRIRW